MSPTETSPDSASLKEREKTITNYQLYVMVTWLEMINKRINIYLNVGT